MTRPSVEYGRALAALHEGRLFDRDEDGWVVADCPRCGQAMRVDGRPGGTARFRCDAQCREEDVAGEVEALAGRLGIRAAGEGVVRFRSPDEIRGAAPEQIDFVLEGYLARRAVTLLAGKPKGGKSTLAFAVAEAMVSGARSFLGRALSPGPVIYVSEEDASTVRAKLPPNGTPLRILTRGDAWPRPSWAALIEAAVAEAERVEATLLVVDTLAFWSDLKADAEKDSGATGEAMDALVGAANAGLAVLLVHHQRKAGGEEGDAVRGSSAITGAVEAILELEREPDAPPGQRRLLALARWTAPGMLLVERDAETCAWRVVGEGAGRGDAGKIAHRDALLRALPVDEPGATYDDLAEVLGVEKPKWHPALKDLVSERLAARSGEGKRGSPFRFRRAPTVSVPESRPPARTETDGNGAAAIPSFASSPPVGGDAGRKQAESECRPQKPSSTNSFGPPPRLPLPDDPAVAPPAEEAPRPDTPEAIERLARSLDEEATA